MDTTKKLLMEKERKEIVKYGKKLIEVGLTTGTGGNLSIYDPTTGYMAIKPSGIDYFEITPKDVVITDLYGNIIDGDLKPSSEYEMHAIVYRNRDDARAMIHTHALYSTTIACLRWDLPAVDYLVAHAGGKNIRCAEYATYGTKELAENALKAMEGRKAVLLANHGINVIGDTMEQTFAILEQLEFCAKLFWQAKAIGDPVILPDEEMEMMVSRFKGYGQQKKSPESRDENGGV
ncbi:L-fuculose-phosphate aldolase [Fervidibacillus halotolerans]|uniref:L-fuculose-phosphate aldolase n=1 Tax=Fervidibacillus halotolerans TaxID=2980027 RepID=A0A9E8RYC2_9BACI|nr:L-fuculose-phosphate aldolase [Fervidibacillus halotolerans]WAA12691.1 L-fuculose-phosphate aldolase [Fervidibacillus halotolerans]